jgi:hypothetical protein
MPAELRLKDPLSIITLPMAGREGPLPWETSFAWPRSGDVQLPFHGENRDARNVWASRLDQAVAQADRAVLLVAENAACLAAIWWARLSPSQYVDLLDRSSGQLFASPDSALPFPSLIVDPADHGGALARSCGGHLLHAPATPPMATGMWRQAQRLIERLSAGVVEQDLRLLRTLGLSEH